MNDKDLSDRSLAHLGVSCDGEDIHDAEGECFNHFEADLVVGTNDSQEVRFGYIINLAVESGWVALGGQHPLTALTFCPEHKDQAEQVEAKIKAKI